MSKVFTKFTGTPVAFDFADTKSTVSGNTQSILKRRNVRKQRREFRSL